MMLFNTLRLSKPLRRRNMRFDVIVLTTQELDGD